jgi:hypothetical protein
LAVTLHLHHLADTTDSTLSELRHEGERLCYILEDGARPVKVAGETRIPAGSYEVVPRRQGGFYERYRQRFGHAFVPWLLNVPGFTWILIHVGNTVRDTRGCLITGTDWHQNHLHDDFWVSKSTEAYHQLYALLAVAFDQGERVFIEIDRGQVEKEPPPEAPEPEPSAPTTPELPDWWLRFMRFFRPH